MVNFWLLYALLTGALVVTAWPTSCSRQNSQCEDIKVPMCLTNTSKYNKTRLPNLIGFTSQAAVRTFTEQAQLQAIVKTQCSKDLVPFLCFVLLPICVTNIDDKCVPPCRTLCENVYRDCIQSIKKLNFTWPTWMNCSGLPNHSDGMCIDPEAFVSPPPVSSIIKLKASCRRNGRRKNPDLSSANLNKYHYIFRAKFEGKRKNNHPQVQVLAQSGCTSKYLKPVTQLVLQKTCTKKPKFKRSDGEVLVLAKRAGKRHITVEKVFFKMKNTDMEKALKRHNCSSKKRNTRKGNASR